MLSGANGPLNGPGSTCRVTNSVGVAAKAIADDPAAGPAVVKVRRSGLDVVFVNRRSLGDCNAEALLPRLTSETGDATARNEALRDDGLVAPSRSAPRGGAGALTDGWPVGVAEVVEAELAPDDAGDFSLGNTGFWSVLDAFELACTPTVLGTSPVEGSGVADGFADDELPVAVDDVDETVVNDGDFEPDGGVDADDELEEGSDGLFLSVDDEVDEPEDEVLDVEPESDGSASATPGMVATAEPTPSATANAPTRPTYLT